MNQINKTAIIVIFITLMVNAQSLWRDSGDYYELYEVENISIDSLKNIIINDNIIQPAGLYEAAVKQLYYFHRNTESQFLLNNLNTEVDTTLPVYFKVPQLDKAYTDAYILGLLGSPIAIGDMETIANIASESIKLDAIGNLAEAGLYDYYNFIKNEYYNGNQSTSIKYLLGLYSRNENYRNEIKNILRNEVYKAKDYFGVIAEAQFLSFIPGAQVEILNEFFRHKTGKERYEYFFELGIYDLDGQPERSMFALQNEPNDTFKVKYLPSVYEIQNYNSESKKYLEPRFINFLETFSLADTNSSLYWMKKIFLLQYKPAIPDSATSINNLLDNLNNYIDSVTKYNWFGDLTFGNQLQSLGQSAKTNLQNGDSLACRSEIKSFQDTVDYVYADSLNPDPRFVTVEGWKFLHWNAQYILDRLPETQQNPNLLVNLQNSQGIQIPASNVKYYDTSWKDAVDNGDGTFTVLIQSQM